MKLKDLVEIGAGQLQQQAREGKAKRGEKKSLKNFF
jgi:hypothetical protein